MPITTLSKVKAVLGITDDSKNERIAALIPIVEDWVKGYTGDTFLNPDNTPYYPSGYEYNAIRLIEFELNRPSENVKSEKLGDYAVTYENTYPKELLKGFRVKVRFF
jgi:hypothetical protein